MTQKNYSDGGSYSQTKTLKINPWDLRATTANLSNSITE